MKTPLCDFISQYEKQNPVRLHMPGHKGVSFLGVEGRDITEVFGADDLYHAEGVILESENNATALFGTRHTFYSAGGSSQCIGAMLYLALLHHQKPSGRNVILAGRNAHKSLLHAAAHLDLDIAWIYPETKEHLCSCSVTAERLEEILLTMEELPMAVYLTSPDYLGNMANIKEIADICHELDLPLLVDNAHGAYLKFLEPSMHPMDLGADLCADSAHKTLPVLTGGAYLHINKNAMASYETKARRALSFFGSTSPSFLILQSLDHCNKWLAEDADFAEAVAMVNACKERLLTQNVRVLPSEPMKIVLDCQKIGMTGYDLAEQLRKEKIECEFADGDVVVCMVSPMTKAVELELLEKTVLPFYQISDVVTELMAVEQALSDISGKNTLVLPLSGSGQHVQKMSIRQAMLSPSETIPTTEALSRICAMPAVSCPPAIPIAISGEEITGDMIAQFLAYGIEEVDVVAE